MHSEETNKLINIDILKGYDALVIGFSGGVDSVALLSMVVGLREELQLKRIVALHVHHGIRGEEADRDAHFCEECAKNFGVEYKLFKGDVPKLAGECKMSEEEAGRMYREKCYKEACLELADSGYNPAVVLAHHADDQAETVIFRMVRGTGIEGVAGIRKNSVKAGITYLRPLLETRKESLIAYVREEGLSYVTDSTNDETEYSRNYIRKNVVPRFNELNPCAVEHISELASSAAELVGFVDGMAEEWLKANICIKEDEYIPMDAYISLDPVFRTYVIRRFIRDRGLSLKNVSKDHYEMLTALGLSANAVSLPGNKTVYARYGRIYIVNENDDNKSLDGFSVTFAEVSAEKAKKIGEKTYTKIVDYDKIKSTLVVRNRMEGDYIVVDEKGSKKSLSRFFIDAKVPKHIRDSVTVVADGEEIVWIVGYRLSMRYYVRDDTTRYMLLKAEG